MKLCIVVAMARNRTIGKDNGLPWHLPEDLRHFKALTMGRPLLMGRRTWESIGRPLPGRTSIVVTRDGGYAVPAGVLVETSIDAALARAGAIAARDGVEECMVIGGAEIYAACLPRTDRIHLTLIDRDIEGDTWFPALEPAQWREHCTGEGQGAAPEALPYRFLVLERSAPA